MSIFIGGPLGVEGAAEIAVPPAIERYGEFLFPWANHHLGHPAYKSGISVYKFDGLVWRYAGERKEHG